MLEHEDCPAPLGERVAVLEAYMKIIGAISTIGLAVGIATLLRILFH